MNSQAKISGHLRSTVFLKANQPTNKQSIGLSIPTKENYCNICNEKFFKKLIKVLKGKIWEDISKMKTTRKPKQVEILGMKNIIVEIKRHKRWDSYDTRNS